MYKNNYLNDLSAKQQMNLINKNYFNEKKLEIYEYNNAYILPVVKMNISKPTFLGGVVDCNKNFIKTSGQYSYGTNDKVVDSYDFDSDDVEYFDEEVIYMNMFFNQWGHFLVDSITRLYYAIEKNYKIAYISLNETDSLLSMNNNHFLQILELMGIDKNRLLSIKKVSKFKKVIIPELCLFPGLYYTKEYIQTINSIIDSALKNKKLIQDRKIYCSRLKYGIASRKDINEKEIEEIFKNNGYEVVYLEDYSASEQICLLNSCKEIVCSSGTLSHNCVFVKNSNCNFTILNKTYRTNVLQYQLNQISKANICFVDAYISALPVSNGKGPFLFVKTDQFVNYCDENKLKLDKAKTIKVSNLIDYYYRWIKFYRKRIFEYKEIGKSDLPECRIAYKDIRKNYRKEIRKYKFVI